MTDPSAPGPKTAGTAYHSDGWNNGGNLMPTGDHYLQFRGTWTEVSFDITVVAYVN